MLGPRQGGLGRYAQQLILNLEKIASDDDFVIFLRKENWNEYEPKNPKFKKVLADVPWYGWREQILLPAIIKKEKVDLTHFPHWNVPLFYNKPFVATIHDLLLLHHPTREASALGPAGYFFKQIMFKKVLNHAARHAKKIITVSEFSKNDIIKTLRIPDDKISVTYPAPFAAEEIANPEARNFPSARKYVLYVGVAYPHKNLLRLLDAWKIFQNKYGGEYKLVLAGKEDFFYKKLKNRYENSGLSALGGQVRGNDNDTTVMPATVKPETVIPAKAGIQSPTHRTADSRFRGNDSGAMDSRFHGNDNDGGNGSGARISPPMTNCDDS
ncbi:MAG: glycosyltransferase, partial [Candidatus Paceibacterota bacterium]